MKERQDTLDLKEDEKDEITKRAAITAVIVHEAIRKEGEDELSRHPAALMWSGLAAGLSMGLSFLGKSLITAYMPSQAAWTPLISNFGYTIGFLVVILGRQQLFTENTLTAVLPLFHNRTISYLWTVMRLWIIVLAANLAGVLLFALALWGTDIFGRDVKTAFLLIGEESLAMGFLPVLVKGIFAGWLIALMVWLLPAAESAKVAIIIIITYLLGLGEFAHIIAGSTEIFYVVLDGSASMGEGVFRFFIPTLIGNIIGGVTLVAALNHAQTMAGSRKT